MSVFVNPRGGILPLTTSQVSNLPVTPPQQLVLGMALTESMIEEEENMCSIAPSTQAGPILTPDIEDQIATPIALTVPENDLEGTDVQPASDIETEAPPSKIRRVRYESTPFHRDKEPPANETSHAAKSASDVAPPPAAHAASGTSIPARELELVLNTLESVLNTLKPVLNTLGSVLNTLKPVLNTVEVALTAPDETQAYPSLDIGVSVLGGVSTNNIGSEAVVGEPLAHTSSNSSDIPSESTEDIPPSQPAHEYNTSTIVVGSLAQLLGSSVDPSLLS